MHMFDVIEPNIVFWDWFSLNHFALDMNKLDQSHAMKMFYC